MKKAFHILSLIYALAFFTTGLLLIFNDDFSKYFNQNICNLDDSFFVSFITFSLGILCITNVVFKYILKLDILDEFSPSEYSDSESSSDDLALLTVINTTNTIIMNSHF